MKTFALEGLPPEIVAALAERISEQAMREDGFLSPVLDKLIPDHIKTHQEWFDVARDLNRLSLKVWLDTKMEGHPLGPNGLAGRLMARATDTFASAVILAERGLTIESQSLARNIYESAFWIGYIAATPDEAAQAFMADELFARSQRGDLVAAMLEGEEAEKVREQAAADKAKSKEGVAAPQPKELAKRAGLEDQYPFYKALCGFAGHASITSLHHYVDQTDVESYGLTIGPDVDGIPRALLFATMAQGLTLRAFGAANNRLDQDLPEIEAIDERVGKMLEAMT